MIDRLFFDTDCISSFLWVKQESIILKLYPGKIVLPMQVYVELSNPSIPHIGQKVNRLCELGKLSLKEILVPSKEYRLYHELAISPPNGEQVIGKGEAAAIALTATYNGILASNNLRDIKKYVVKYKLDHLTTGDILAAALDAGYIDEALGNQIWRNMIARKRMLPTDSFTDYIKSTR